MRRQSVSVRSGECLAQPCAGVSLKSSASRSAGDIQPSVCRGRPLSSAATASRRSWVSELMSERLGEVLAQEAVRVLVSAALPGALGIAEVDLDAAVDRE